MSDPPYGWKGDEMARKMSRDTYCGHIQSENHRLRLLLQESAELLDEIAGAGQLLSNETPDWSDVVILRNKIQKALDDHGAGI